MKRNEFLAAAIEIRILMAILTKLVRHELQEHLDRCGVPMSGLHHGVLRLLKHRPYTISELSKHMVVEPASLVPVVDDLERKSWVRRGTDPADRRRTPLLLTEEGDRLLTSLPMMPSSSPYVRTLERMGEQRVFELLATLRELADGASENKDIVPEISRTVQIQMGGRAALTPDKKPKH